MKYTIALACLALLACNSAPQKEEKSIVKDISWLEGNWVRTNGDEGELTYEFWKKSTDGYEGSALTIMNGDTVFQESIRVYMHDSRWHYEVSGPNDKPVIFSSTSVSDSHLVCENPEHDYPKIISYAKDGECINAIISDGGQKEILFRYEKKVN